jgi:hypothetical protein
VFALFLGLGAAAAWRLLPARARPLPEAPAVAVQVRERARLEALEVLLYKKIRYAPEPQGTDSLWGDVLAWARYSLRSPEGRAIVFARAHLGLDLDRLGPESLKIAGRIAWLVLPPIRVQVELQPGETEIIGSNLDSKETAQLFELAKAAFEREVEADAALQARARESAQRSIRGLLLGMGFEQVRFVAALPGAAGSG